MKTQKRMGCASTQSTLRLLLVATTGAALCGASAGAALAQSAQDSTELPPLTVEAKKQTIKKKTASKKTSPVAAPQPAPAPMTEQASSASTETARGPVDGFVAKRTATGTKTDAALIEIPQSISVVTPDQMEVQGVENIEQALTYTPGVIVDSYGSNPEQDYIFLRGFHAPIFVDGVRQFRDYIVGAQAGFEPYGFERIEVLRGPASVLYGQTEVGGIVNMVTKRPTDVPQNEVALQFGSFDRTQAAFDFSGPVDREGKVSYRLTGLGRVADGQMDFQGDDRVFIAPVLEFKPDADTRFTIVAQYQRDRDQLRPVGLPAVGTLYPNPNGKVPYNRFLGNPNFDRFERDQYSVGYEFEHRLDSTWTFRQNLRYSHSEQHENFSVPLYDYLWLFDYRTVERIPWDNRNQISAFGIDNQAQAKFSTGEILHTMLFGVDHHRVRSDWQFAGNYDYPTVDAFDPVYGLYGPLSPGIDDTRRQTQTGVYVQDLISLGRWRFTLGGRYDWAEGSTDSRLSDFYGGPDQNDEAFTGRAGVVYLFDNGLAPYASYATSFDPPTGGDANGNPLKPTTGEQAEVGVKYQPPGSNSFITLAAFEITKQNVLTTAAGSPKPVQVGEVRVRGFEAEAKVEVLPGFNILGSYTYLDSEITEDDARPSFVGRPLQLTPENQFALWLDYEFRSGPLDGLGLGAGVRYRGEAWGLNHEIEMPDYALVDASVRYDLGGLGATFDGYSVSVTARNLFDEDYIPACSFIEGCYYGDRRNIVGTIKYQW